MDRKLIRRQFILLLMLAGIAYLWWQSQSPSRYAEWTEDLETDSTAAFQWPADDIDWRYYGGDIYTSDDDSLSIHVWTAIVGDGEHYRIEHQVREEPRRRIYLNTGRGGPIRWLSIRESDGSRLDLTVEGDSASIEANHGDSTARWMTWPGDAVFHDALLVHGRRWALDTTEREATLVKYDPRTGVFLQFPVSVKSPSDTTRSIWSRDRFVIDLTFTRGGRVVQSVCDSRNICWKRTDGYVSLESTP